MFERIAFHLAAGRASLAQKMLQRETAPAGVPADAWAALQAFTAWRAGSGDAPSEEGLQLIALHFRSLRKAGVIHSASVHAACQA